MISYRMAKPTDTYQIAELAKQAGTPPHENTSEIIVAEQDNKVVAILYITTALLLDRLFIHPEARGGQVSIGKMVEVADQRILDQCRMLDLPYASYLALVEKGRQSRANELGFQALPYDVYIKFLEM